MDPGYRAPKPPEGAVALTAFRELAGGRGRQYTESWATAFRATDLAEAGDDNIQAASA